MPAAIRAETRFVPGSLESPRLSERVSEAGLVDVVVHEGVQNVLLALNRAGCASLAEEKAVGVVRRLGGYGEIATRALDAHLEKLAPNPRMSSQVDRPRQRLGHRYAEMRQAIQALVSQSPIIHTKPDVARARSADYPPISTRPCGRDGTRRLGSVAGGTSLRDRCR